MRSPKRIQEESFFVFLLEADKDYILARHIHFIGGVWGSRAGYFAQAACEKYMKALTVTRGQYYLATHSLAELAKHCEQYDDYFALPDTKAALDSYEHFEQIGRYGGAANPKRSSSQGQLEGVQHRGVWMWGNNSIHALDAFVKEVRGMIPVEPKYNDQLKGIAEGREGLILPDSWKGFPPIREVLLRENYSFP